MRKIFTHRFAASLRRLTAGVALIFALGCRPPRPPAREPLVSPAWLNSHLHDANLVVLDIRSAIDGSKPEAFAQGHIPGSVHSDYDKAGWRVTRNNVPFMVPTMPELEKLIGDLGIDETSHVVVVPAGVNVLDFGSAARTYWTLKYRRRRQCLDPRRRPRRLEGGGLCARQGSARAVADDLHRQHRQQHPGARLRRRDHRAERRRHAGRRAPGVVLPRQGEGARGAGLRPHPRRGRCRQRPLLRSGHQPAEAEGGTCHDRRRAAGRCGDYLLQHWPLGRDRLVRAARIARPQECAALCRLDGGVDQQSEPPHCVRAHQVG